MIDYEELTEVIKALGESQDADSDMRDHAREADSFLDKRNGQWEDEIYNTLKNRPRYTFDKCNPIVDQITGEMDNADFTLRVKPAGGQASKDNAQIYDGIIRNIRNISNAENVFNSAGRGLVASGIDGWEIIQDYVDADAFEQDLFIRKIHNFKDRVWFDQGSEEQDHNDAKWVIVLSTLTPGSYEKQFPDGSAKSVDQQRRTSSYKHKPEFIVIGKLLYKKPITIDIVKMSDGAVYKDDEKFQSVVDELAKEGIVEEKRRTRKSHRVYSRIFDGDNWLTEPEETVFSHLPVTAAYGNYKVSDNKRIYRGVVEKLMDAQRVYNYAASRQIEEGALAPRAKKWMTPEQAEGYEAEIKTMNTNADPVQFYNHVPNHIPPYDTPGAVINAGLQVTAQQASDDLNASAGMFAANMADNPGLQSGVAIERQISKGDNGTVKWFSAMEVALTYTGKILVDAIPRVYDSTRQIRLLQEDGSFEMQTLNKVVFDEQTQRNVEINNLSSGQYDVTCERGLAFKSRQQEAASAFTEMAAIDPSIIETAKDVYYNNLDAPGMDKIAERAREQLLMANMIPESQQTDEEKQQMQQIQQQQAQNPQPDAMMVAAEAEMKKADADMMAQQNKQTELQIRAQEVGLKGQEQERKNSEMQLDVAKLQQNQQEIDFKTEVDTHGANLKTREQEIDINKAQAEINYKQAQTEKVEMETQAIKTNTIKYMQQAQSERLQGNESD